MSAAALPAPTMTAIVDQGIVRIVLDTRPPDRQDEDDAPLPAMRRRPYRRVVCGACGTPGHSRANRKCPARA